MKSYYRVLQFVAVVMLLVSCDRRESEAPANTADVFDRVAKRGVIRAGYFVQPPAVMKDPNTRIPRGTFVDALNAIATEAGWRVEFVEIDLAKFAAGLNSDLYDVSIGPTFRTIPRAKAVEFTVPCYFIGYDGVTRRGQESRFLSEKDINQKGVRVAVKEGSAIHKYATDRFKLASVLVLSGTDLTLPLQAVSSGQADVGLMNEHTVEYYARAHPEVSLVLDRNPIQIIGMSWAVKPGNQRWLNFLNTSLEALISSGQMAEWERRHHGSVLRRGFVEPATTSVQTPGASTK